MIEICLEQGEATLEELHQQRKKLKKSINKLDSILSVLGLSNSLVNKIFYKDKLNYLLVLFGGGIIMLIVILLLFL